MFESPEKASSLAQSLSMQGNLSAVYSQAKAVVAAFDLYSSGEDQTYNAAVDLLLTANERDRMNSAADCIRVLIAEFESNYRDVFGLDR